MGENFLATLGPGRLDTVQVVQVVQVARGALAG